MLLDSLFFYKRSINSTNTKIIAPLRNVFSVCPFFIAYIKAIGYPGNIYILFIHQGKRISFYKRAQILVADTWSVLEGKGDGCFDDISSITMFADYRLPQVLVHLGALKYSKELLEKLLKGLPA